MTVSVAAVDLGATSGRVILGHVGPDTLETRQVGRFVNEPVRLGAGLHWNIAGLYAAALAGLREGFRTEPGIASIGVDSWAVDYALLRDGRLLGVPFHYRDARTAAGVDATHARATHAELFARNGLQFLPFNTLYQLAAEPAAVREAADTLLLVPDLIGYWLTGRAVAERTNASTTGLLDPRTGAWDDDLITRLGLDARLLPPIIAPGDRVGTLREDVRETLGAPADVRVTAIGSHDTASAVVAVPMDPQHSVYISCGTWGLVGVETATPVLTDEARAAGFTNEGGVDARTRLLTNVMGLWVLSESIRAWQREGDVIDLPALLAAAADVTESVPVFDVDDAVFLAPGDMPARIAAWLADRGLPVPASRAAFARCIVESLAAAFARAAVVAADLGGVDLRTVHIVGGGALNELLCQRTADRTGVPVVAGPIEATALGNVLVQARALGAVSGSLEALRDLVRRTHEPRTFTPHP